MSGTTTIVLGMNSNVQIKFEDQDPNLAIYCSNDDAEGVKVELSDALLELSYNQDAACTIKAERADAVNVEKLSIQLTRVETAMIIRALRQYNAHLAVRGDVGVPHKHGEPWALGEAIEERTGVEVPKQLAYFG